MKRAGVIFLISLAGLLAVISLARLRTPGGVSGDAVADFRAADSHSADSLSATDRREAPRKSLRFERLLRAPSR